MLGILLNVNRIAEIFAPRGASKPALPALAADKRTPRANPPLPANGADRILALARLGDLYALRLEGEALVLQAKKRVQRVRSTPMALLDHPGLRLSLVAAAEKDRSTLEDFHAACTAVVRRLKAGEVAAAQILDLKVDELDSEAHAAAARVSAHFAKGSAE